MSTTKKSGKGPSPKQSQGGLRLSKFSFPPVEQAPEHSFSPQSYSVFGGR